MPIGYLVPVALIAFATTVAIVGPRPPHTTPSYWGYWVTFQLNEQPFGALYALAAVPALPFAQGDLGTPVGRAGLGLAVLTAAGLLVLVRRAASTGAALRRALGAAGITIPPARRPWARILLTPL